MLLYNGGLVIHEHLPHLLKCFLKIAGFYSNDTYAGINQEWTCRSGGVTFGTGYLVVLQMGDWEFLNELSWGWVSYLNGYV